MSRLLRWLKIASMYPGQDAKLVVDVQMMPLLFVLQPRESCSLCGAICTMQHERSKQTSRTDSVAESETKAVYQSAVNGGTWSSQDRCRAGFREFSPVW